MTDTIKYRPHRTDNRVSAPVMRWSRTRTVGCSPTPMPRWAKWAVVLAFIAPIAASVVGAFAPPTTFLWVATGIAYLSTPLALIAVAASMVFPELFRRNR